MSSILTNPAYVSSKSDEEEGQQDAATVKEETVEASEGAPGSLTLEGKRQLAVTNLAFRPEEEKEDVSEA